MKKFLIISILFAAFVSLSSCQNEEYKMPPRINTIALGYSFSMCSDSIKIHTAKLLKEKAISISENKKFAYQTDIVIPSGKIIWFFNIETVTDSLYSLNGDYQYFEDGKERIMYFSISALDEVKGLLKKKYGGEWDKSKSDDNAGVSMFSGSNLSIIFHAGYYSIANTPMQWLHFTNAEKYVEKYKEDEHKKNQIAEKSKDSALSKL